MPSASAHLVTGMQGRSLYVGLLVGIMIVKIFVTLPLVQTATLLCSFDNAIQKRGVNADNSEKTF